MRLWSRLTNLIARRKLDAEMSEELRVHLEMLAERNRAAGMSPEEARYAARRQFGGVEQVKERCREQRAWLWLENRVRELRLAVRSLRRAPAFSLAVIATLALCIGPNTAILTALYALVIKPPPFREPERIVQIYNTFDKLGGGRSRGESSVPQFRDFKAGADLFADFAIMRYAGSTLDEDSTPLRVTGMRVNAGFFEFLGVRPLLGRFGTPEEDAIGRDHVLVLTQSFWETRFQGDPGVIGRVVRMGGEPWTIIGVAPRAVEVFDRFTLFFKPFEVQPNEQDPVRSRYVGKTILFGRLKPGVTRQAAAEQLNAIDGNFLERQAPPAMRTALETSGHRIALERLGAQVAGTVRLPLSLLQGGALFVLAIGAVNVLNLMLARTSARRPELAVRHALGAGPSALVGQLVAESVLLTAVATLAGVALGWVSLRMINVYLPQLSPRAPPVAIEPAMLGVAVAVALGLAVLVGAVPFALVGRTGLQLGETRTASAGARVRVFGGALVVIQVAVALLLLVGAGLLVRSFAKVLATDLGFDAAHLVQGRVAVPRNYERGEANIGLQRRIVDGLREIPGVQHAALVLDYALAAEFRPQPLYVRGAGPQADGGRPLVGLDPVSPEFFETMRIELLEGRGFTYADDPRSAPVVVVDDLFARRYFPDRSAVGQEVTFGEPPGDRGRWVRIIGVVRRPQISGQEGRDGMPLVFIPMVQQTAAGFAFVVRSARPTGDLVAAIRAKLREIEPLLPVYGTATLEDGLDSMMTARRGVTLLITVFGGLAFVLAGVGLYGVLAYDVTQRTREIGIRGAIGATRGQIVGMVLRQGLLKTVVGVTAGLAAAACLTRFLRGLLFDVGPFDPVAFAGVPLLMMGMALLACWLPARRAAKVDPIVALRCE